MCVVMLLFHLYTASEYRSWALFYGLPVLKGVLDKDYLNHFALFSEALWLLLQSSPTFVDISKAEKLLQHFCFKFSVYYGTYMYMLLILCVKLRVLLWSHR